MSHFAWLATGPDTMPDEARHRLSDLLLYWQLFAAGRGKSKITRGQWLRMPSHKRLAMMFQISHPQDAIERICYADQPFLRFLPKVAPFAGATR